MRIPEGYAEVKEGLVYLSDLVWNPMVDIWVHPRRFVELGTAKSWLCVIRRACSKCGLPTLPKALREDENGQQICVDCLAAEDPYSDY